METIKPKIWVKSYPYPQEIAALADLGKQDVGIEVFLGGDMLVNEECTKICSNEFPRFGIELFVYQNEEKRKPGIIYDIFSPDKTISSISKGYFWSNLELAERHGAEHLQLDANNGYQGRPGQDINARKQEFIQQRLEFLESLRKAGLSTRVLYENTYPIDDHTPEPVFSCIGHNLSDFGVNGLPLEYDLAHHAVALDVYSKADQFSFPLTEQERGLATRVREKGMTDVIVEELQGVPEIYFTHLGNTTGFALLTKTDESIGSRGELINLERILPILMKKTLNITPEVGEPTGDFKKRPYLREWVKKLKDY